MSGKTSIVIIGAGGAGVGTAKALDAKLDPAKHELTIISSHDYYLHYPAALRAVVTAEGHLEKDMALPYDRLFGKQYDSREGRLSTFVVDTVVSVEEHTEAQGGGGTVVLESGRRVEWDILVIATGSEWNGPLRWPNQRDEVDTYLANWREKFATAKSVVVTGAGAVGSELVGEIKDFYPDTEVTIVNRGPLPLNDTYPASFRRRLANEMRARGIRVILEDEVDNLSPSVLDGSDPVKPGRTVTTKKGERLAADLIVPTVGRRGVNTSFLRTTKTTITSALGPDGHLSVSPTLQLTTNPKVFAGGDLVSLPEQHTLIKALAHADVISNNILVLLGGGKGKGKGKDQLKSYQKAMDSIIITNGRTRGSTYLDFFTFFGWPIVLGNWLSTKFKSSHLMVSMPKGNLNID